MTLKEKAEKIIEFVGGENNVRSFSHCITRLRFQLSDNNKAKLNEIKALDGIVGAQVQNGQVQVIIGPEVGKVFREITKQFPKLSADSGDGGKKEKKSIFNRILDTLSSILVASLAPIVGGGMLKGFLFLLTSNFKVMDPSGGTAVILNITADCMFYFFPFLLAVSAAKRFKTNEYMALSVAGAIMYPSIIEAAAEGTVINFLGFIPIMAKNYSASVVPIILSVFILSYVYKFMEDIIPSIVSIIFVPLLTLLIMVPLSLFCIAPIGFYLGEYVAIGIQALINAAPWLAGFVVGATRPLLVLTGMHHAIRPISSQQIATYGYSTFGAMNFMSTMAQATAALGTYLIIKNKKMKQIAGSSAVSGFIGITEPALYGIIVKYKAAMAGALLGGGIGGMVGTVLGARAYAPAMPSVFSIPVYLGENTFGFFIGFLVTVGSTLAITVILGKSIFKIDEETQEDNGASEKTLNIIDNTCTIYSPVAGEVISIKDLGDETFSSEVMGKSIAIKPLNGNITAPSDGIVKTIFKTKHALGFETTDGVEILIHIGIDTVNLDGKYFDLKCKEGKRVQRGELLLTFDKDAIESEGYDTSVIMIVLNTDEYLSVIAEDEGNTVRSGDKTLTVVV